MKEELRETGKPGSMAAADRAQSAASGNAANQDGWQVPHEKKPGWKEEVWEWVKIIVSAALIAFVLNTFIIANSEVPSGSMENTIMTGDRVIGSRLTYRFKDPERGDIAIFRFPDNEKIFGNNSTTK